MSLPWPLSVEALPRGDGAGRGGIPSSCSEDTPSSLLVVVPLRASLAEDLCQFQPRKRFACSDRFCLRQQYGDLHVGHDLIFNRVRNGPSIVCPSRDGMAVFSFVSCVPAAILSFGSSNTPWSNLESGL